MEENKAESSSNEEVDLGREIEKTLTVPEENEDFKLAEEKADKIRKCVSSDHSKMSSIDITVTIKRSDVDDRTVMYSAKQLSEIRGSIASSEWPDFLDENFKNARGQWDPDRWHQNRKRGSTPPPGEGDKSSERREREAGYQNSERSNITKTLGIQDRSMGLPVEGNRKKLADPRERLKSECEGIVLSPQRRSFTTGCQVAQTAAKEDNQEKQNHDKGNRQNEREVDGLARDRNRDSRGNDHRSERSLYDRGIEKEELPLSFREGRRRDGVTLGNDIEDRGRRVGSGRIITNRADRERGLSGDDHGLNDRARNDRTREQYPIDRNMYENREKALAERRGIPPIDRREIGRDDGRDMQNNRSRFGFQRERDHEDPRERLRRDIEPNDAEYDRARGRDVRGDWNDVKIKEYEQRRERIPANQQNYQGMDRQYSRNEKREEHRFEPEREQRFNKFQQSEDRNYQQKFQEPKFQGFEDSKNFGYGRNGRGGRYPRRSETEEPEWMSESVQMGGELMELRGFDDSPEKEVSRSFVGKQSEKKRQTEKDERVLTNNNDSVNINSSKTTEKETKHDSNFISMDDIFHLDSIPGLANILADDSIDPTSFGEHSILEQNLLQDGINQERNKVSRDGGSKFSQFFQHDSKPSSKPNQRSSPNFHHGDTMNIGQTHLGFKGFLQTSNHTEMFSNENRNNGQGFNNIVSIPENNIGPNIRIPSPGNPSAYFAPISPAAKTSNIEDLASSSSSKNPLMDMLRIGSSTHEDNESEEMPKGAIPPTLNQLRGNKNVKSVEELEADIKQMVGICQEDDSQGSVTQQRYLSDVPQGPIKQYNEDYFDIKNCKEDDNVQEQNEDMSAFRKFAALMEVKDVDQDDHKIQMNYKENIGLSGNGMFDGIPPGVVKPSPIPLNAPTEDDIFQGRQHSRRAVPVNPSHSNDHQQHISHPPMMKQNSPDFNRANHSISQPLQHLPQPMPRTPHSIQAGLPIPDQAILQLIYQAPFSPELLKLSEAVTLQTALKSGQVAPDVVLNQFIHGNLPPIRREILLNVLKVAQNEGRLGPLPPGRASPSHFNNLQQFNMGGNTTPLHNPHQNIHSSSKQGARISPPMPLSPGPDPIQMLMQQQNKHPQHQPQSVSPMLLGVGSQAGSKNTLAVSPVPSQQRVPSPQELVVHTQQIMQNALIKRKLEEQKENYRRRQDYQGGGPFRERSNSDSKGNGSGNACGDSPLAFTPMSVMKKMAADRRDSDPRIMGNIPELKLCQVTSNLPDEAIRPLGDIGLKMQSLQGNSKLEGNGADSDKISQQYEDTQRLNNIFSDTRKNIQSGPSPSTGILAPGPVPPQMSQAPASSNQLNQIQLQQAAAMQRAQQIHNQWALNSTGNTRPPPFPGLGPMEHHLLMQQHGYGGPMPPNVTAAVPTVGSQFPQSHQLPQLQTFPGGNQQILPMPNTSSLPQQIGMPSALNAHHSQPFGAAAQGNLSKFFSPEVLAQAQAGNAPSMPPLPTQKALTLEEIELQAAAVRI